MRDRDKKQEQRAAEKRVDELETSEFQHRRKERRTQEALKYAESIIETVREPLLVLGSDLRIVRANRSFYDFFKVTPAETIGSFIYDLGNRQWNIPGLRTLLEDILPQDRKFDDYEIEHEFLNIGHKIMLINARQVTQKEIGSRTILLAIEDITERRQAEEVLRQAHDELGQRAADLTKELTRADEELHADITLRKEAECTLKVSETQYRRLFEAAEGILILNLQTAQIDDVNPSLIDMLGYTYEEFRGKKLWEIGAFKNIEANKTIFTELRDKGYVRYENLPLVTKDGREIAVEFLSNVYMVDSRKLVQCNIRDITDRKRAEEKQKESEDKYRSIVENAVEGITQSTPEGQLISANPAFARMIGYDSPEEVIKNIHSIGEQLYVNPEERARFKKMIDDNGVMKGFETQHYRRDGSIIWVSVSSRVVRDPTGKVLYYEGTIEDITARKAAEEELRQHTAKLRTSLIGTIKVISMIVEARDPYTAGHQKRVSNLARVIAQDMALPNDTVDSIRMAGIIHDIGKISVPTEILSKPGKLTDIELSLIKVHPQSGYDILEDAELPYPIAEIVLQHHERLDGSGYPQSLKDNQILLESRIIAVADVVEAIASYRPYRPARGIDAALEEIEKNKGILYDEKVVEACVKLFREKQFSFEGHGT